MAHCDHNWKYGAPSKSADDLLTRITDAKEKGLWIQDTEMDFASVLLLENKIVMCSTCERSATLV